MLIVRSYLLLHLGSHCGNLWGIDSSFKTAMLRSLSFNQVKSVSKAYSQLALCQVGSRPSRHFAEYIHRNSYPKRHASWHPILIDTKSEVFVHLLFQCLLTSGLLSVMRPGSTTLTTFGQWIFSIQMHFSCKHWKFDRHFSLDVYKQRGSSLKPRSSTLRFTTAWAMEKWPNISLNLIEQDPT